MILILFGLLKAHSQSEIYTSLEVDDLPVIEKCEEFNADSFQDCLKNYVQYNIDITSLTKYATAKAYAQFVIIASGKIENLQVRATNEDLKNQAYKLLDNLKIKSPAMKNGVPVSMTYVIPIRFNRKIINKDGSSAYPSSRDLETKGPELAFKDAFILPLIKECESSGNKTCFADLITKRIVNI
tara:strand:+ start:12554 stop:13105 length:552 start_codon:yes stop_codon:yes gene_type:complete